MSEHWAEVEALREEHLALIVVEERHRESRDKALAEVERLRKILDRLYQASGAVIAEDEPAEYMKPMRAEARTLLGETEAE